jgi:hypothetical protein
LSRCPASALKLSGPEYLEIKGAGETAGRVERGADRQRVLDLPG